MDASTKLVAAIVAAAAIMVGGYIAYSEYAQSRDGDQAHQASAPLQQPPQKTVETEQRPVSQTQPDPRIASDVAELRTQYRHLAPNERCVDGVVIQVDGATYAQSGSGGRSVRCTGSYAER